MSYTVRVNDVYQTVQGEGCQTGVPMVLVRLHGCGVGCPWCDTKHTWYVEEHNRVEPGEHFGDNPLWAEWEASDLAAYCTMTYPALRWILLTGGEPADQELGPLVEAFHDYGLMVALETSGTATGHVGAGCDWVCVSPKVGMPGGRRIKARAVAEADEIKFVVGKAADIEKAEAFLREFVVGEPEICLQPLSASEKATKLCVDACLQRGWRLSIQTHKAVGLR